MSLEALGWNEHWQAKFEANASAGRVPARVIGEHRNHYRVATGDSELPATITTRQRKAAAHRSDLPGVGDFVALSMSGPDGMATIEGVLPRTSALIRKASGIPDPQLLAANVDVVFIVTARGGDFNLARIKRYLALVETSGASSVIIVNKSDLADDGAGSAGRIEGIDPATPVHLIGARAHDNLHALEPYFAGNRTVVLVGSSGVGKSTLTNRLLGREAQATQEVRSYDDRGRHTTTHRELFVRPEGGSIIDTPGLRGLEAWTGAATSVANFDDIERFALQCKFSNCQHRTERDCAVLAAVERGEIDRADLSAYADAAKDPGRRTR